MIGFRIDQWEIIEFRDDMTAFLMVNRMVKVKVVGKWLFHNDNDWFDNCVGTFSGIDRCL
jgi:hypothetical protein